MLPFISLTSVWIRQVSTTYNAVDPRSNEALGIAVSGTNSGTSRVQRRATAVCPHLREVQSAVHTARQLGDIDVEGKLLAGQLEHLVVLLALVEKVRSGARELLVLAVEVHAQACAVGEDTIVLVVADGLEDAVLRAGLLIGAYSRVRCTTPVAATLGGVVLLVDVVACRVEDNVAVLSLAAALLGALVSGQLGLLLLALAERLGRSNSQESRRDDAVVNHGE